MMKPKIRFKGFEGEWKASKLGEIAPLSGGYAFQSNHFSSVGIPIVRISNILETGIVGGDFAKYATFNGDAEFRLYDGDAVIAMSGATTGKVAVVHTQEFLYQNQRVGKFTKTDKVNYDFLTTIVKSHKFRADLSSLLTSSAQPNASSRDIDSITQSIPFDKDEQKVIGKYFTSLDSQISASTSRLASLKQMKAASLQAMFPQEGETMPKIRFKGFEGEWKKVKFSNIAIIFRGLTYSPEDIVKEGVRVLRSSNIDDDTFILTNSDVYVSNKCVNIDAIQKGDILITAANGSSRLVGKHTLVKEYDAKMQVAGGFMLRVISNESDFLNASMSSDWYKRFLKTGVAGGNGAIGNLNKNDLEETVLFIPKTKKERDAIANYFTSLDRQIFLQSQRLEKLKQIKSACLDKMFV